MSNFVSFRFFNLSVWRLFLGALFIVLGFLKGFSANAVTIVERYTVGVEAGAEKQISVSVKNTTGYTWYGKDDTYLYLYGYSSPFKHSSWKTDDRIVSIDQSQVAPNETATASFLVKAPSKTGTYSERFLMGTGSEWHDRSVIEITFNVVAVGSGTSGQTSTSSPAPQTVGQTSTSSPAPKSLGESTVVSSVPVADTNQYRAELLDKGGIEWQLDPGHHTIAILKFKNTGTRSWRKESPSVALWSTQTNSPFKDFSWKEPRIAGFLRDLEVVPGGVGTFQLELRAPDVPNSYSEDFDLFVGDSRIEGSRATLAISVRRPSEFFAGSSSDSALAEQEGGSVLQHDANQYAAKLLLQPRGGFTVSGNATISVQYGFKNIGMATWKNHSVRLKEVSPDLGKRFSGVRHDTWSSAVIANRSTAVTDPGRLEFVAFKVKAPAKKGTYTARFAVLVDEKEVPGGYIDIPITVTADGYIEPEPENGSAPSGSIVSVPDPGNLPPEPIIRVGLFETTDDTLMVRGVDSGFSLNQNNQPVCTFNPGEVAQVVYDRSHGVYRATGPRCQTQSTEYYVAVAPDGIAPLEVTDFYRPVSWLPGANDNKFRGKLELRYTPSTDKVWLINELPIEYYLRGIAETSDVSPMEFQKTLLVAARTYAMYHVERGTKHAKEFYTVDAKYDQVYRGYGQEARSPRIVAGVESTRGIIVTYDNRIAITPYFSRSDGRTRSWSEVWYGEVPWCQGVPVPYDEGKTLWGHGVGMSASGALRMAAYDNMNYEQILTYFYQGIQLQRWYR